MIPQTRKYHVITVHYGNSGPAKTLVEQLLQSSPAPDRIIVVDHAEDPLLATWNKERVTVIRPAKNAGYAGGINLGLGVLLGKQTARSDIVVVLNNDTKIEADTLARIQAWWQTHPEPAVAGIKMGVLNLVTGRANLQDNLSAKSPAFWRTRLNAQEGFRRARFQLPYLHGALLTASLDTFLALQGLPNHFFMYWEDVLFSLRAQQMEIPLKVIPDTGVAHDDALRADVSSDHLYYLVRNGAVFLGNNSPRPWRWLWRCINYARLAYHSLRSPTPRVRTTRQALRDALLRRTGKRP